MNNNTTTTETIETIIRKYENVGFKSYNKTIFTLNGKYHNKLDEPAVIYDDGDVEYWKYGKLHRTNGLARICNHLNYDKSGLLHANDYWVNGKKINIPNNMEGNPEQIKQYLELVANF